MNYLTLVNSVLNELNEVELTATTFSTSRGVQTMVKNVVNKAVNDIYNSEIEWPFLIENKTESVSAGTQEYTLPSDFRKVDWGISSTFSSELSSQLIAKNRDKNKIKI